MVGVTFFGVGNARADKPTPPPEVQQFLEDPAQSGVTGAEGICSDGQLISLETEGKVNVFNLARLARKLQENCAETAQSSKLATATATTYTRTCYSEYVGRSMARVVQYKLWVKATAYVTMTPSGGGGRIVSFANPPSYGAQTYIWGWQYSDLKSSARWFAYPYEMRAYATANFALKMLGSTWSQVTRWAWADIYHKDGFSMCRWWSY